MLDHLYIEISFIFGRFLVPKILLILENELRNIAKIQIKIVTKSAKRFKKNS